MSIRPLRAFSPPRALTPSLFARTMARTPLNRPSPPPLPPQEQREFEELLRKAQTPLAQDSQSPEDMGLHPDARRPIEPEFTGDVNPVTGEQGGPKREPVGRWSEDGGDWSFKGRVSDF
ncbi:hypothetical protein AX16_000727 [Volvariella volvacea WC 439]|nr:hypothetical protein AX16_000727 [Volvariella volvacea WC 439]